jgi:phosphoribosylformimino-5-aminoimidazole carboxamide ribotide isomerase
MILFPAIDLKDGQCVRLYQGDMQKATVFNSDAGAQVREFSQAGFAWLHVVDLNGAFAGRPVNGAAVDAILDAATMPVQLGGGIRDLETIAMWLDRGVSRIVLGTVALRDPDLVRQACQAHPGRVAVGIDAVDGYVAVEGWAEVSAVTALDLALEFENAGVAAIIHTDVERDGAMAGPNIEASQALADSLSTPVIVSGGVSSLADLASVKAAESSGIAGVIVGRALYDGGLDGAAALALLAG